jgi:hypothetical protein
LPTYILYASHIDELQVFHGDLIAALVTDCPKFICHPFDQLAVPFVSPFVCVLYQLEPDPCARSQLRADPVAHSVDLILRLGLRILSSRFQAGPIHKRDQAHFSHVLALCVGLHTTEIPSRGYVERPSQTERLHGEASSDFAAVYVHHRPLHFATCTAQVGLIAFLNRQFSNSYSDASGTREILLNRVLR